MQVAPHIGRSIVPLVFALFAAQAAASITAIGPGRPGFDPARPSTSLSAFSTSTVVYNNTTVPLGNYLGGFPYEAVADDITLGPGPRLFSSLQVQYFGVNFDGDETLQVAIHAMDGPPTPGSFGFNTPGAVLYTATVPITEGVTSILFPDPLPSIVLPDVVAVALGFDGVDFDPSAGSDAGPLLADPPDVGSSFNDYWIRGFPNVGDPWGLYTFGGAPPINFALTITTIDKSPIPEPPALLAWSGLGVCVAGALWWRRMVKDPPYAS